MDFDKLIKEKCGKKITIEVEIEGKTFYLEGMWIDWDSKKLGRIVAYNRVGDTLLMNTKRKGKKGLNSAM